MSDGDEGGEGERSSVESPRDAKQDPTQLPIELAAGLSGAPALSLEGELPPVYVPSDELEELGGEAEAFRLIAEEGDSAAGVCPPDTGSRDQACESLGEYPLLDTTEALARLNTLVVGGGGTEPSADASAGTDQASPPITAQPVPPEPGPPETAPPSTACILMLPDDGNGSVCDERRNPDTPATTMVAPGPPATDPPITIEPPGGPTTTAPGSPPTTAPPTSSPPATVEPPEGPPTTAAPQPAEIEVTAAEVVYVEAPAWDDSGSFLVPAYRFTAADGSTPTVLAIADEMLTPPE